MDMSHKTLKQLFPEMSSTQRMTLGNRLSNILDVKVEPKIEEDGYMVRLYHKQNHNEITLEAVKMFGNN